MSDTDTGMYSSLSEAESKGGSVSDNDSLFDYGSRGASPAQDLDTEGPRRWRPSPPPQETWDDVDEDMEWGYKIVGEELDYDGVAWYEVRWDDWARSDGTKTTWHRADDKETEINPSQWIAEQSRKRQQLAQKNLSVELPPIHSSGGSSGIDRRYTLAQIPFSSPALALHLLPTWYQSQAYEERLKLSRNQQTKKGGIPNRLVELAEMREKRKQRALKDKDMTEEERSVWLATLNGPSLGTFGSSQATASTQSLEPTKSQLTQAGSSTQGAFSFSTEEDIKLTQSSNMNTSSTTFYSTRTRQQVIAEAEKTILKAEKTHTKPTISGIPTYTVSSETLVVSQPHSALTPVLITHRVISNNIPVVKLPNAIAPPPPKPSTDPFSRTPFFPVTIPIKVEETHAPIKSQHVVKTGKAKWPRLVVEVVPPPLPTWAQGLKQPKQDPPVTPSVCLGASKFSPSTIRPSRSENSSSETPTFNLETAKFKGKERERPEDTIRRLLSEKWSGIASRFGSASICIKNDVDDELLPLDDAKFTYLEECYMLDKGVFPTDPGFLLPCSCVGKCVASTCSCHALSTTPIFDCGKPVFAYTDEGLFAFNQQPGEEVVECNPLCRCSRECSNRASQRPRDFPIEVFKTKKRGWGACSSQAIPRGKILGLYTGLMIMREKAKEIPEKEEGYYFDLDHDEWDSSTAHSIIPEHEQFTVDSRVHGNWTRFINHSCSPNLAVYTVVRDVPPSVGKGFIIFYATTDIPPYTEFTVDYDPNSNHTLILLRDKIYKVPAFKKKGGKKKVTEHHGSWREFVEARVKLGELEASIRCGCDNEACRGYIYVHMND